MKAYITEDGSLTCRDPETGELYHNRAGARAEALAHYVKPSGILSLIREKKRANLLDVFFGLGYNTLTLVNELLNDPPPSLHLSVTAIEWDEAILARLPQVLAQPVFAAIASAGMEVTPDRICIRPDPGKTVEIRLVRDDARQIIPALAERQPGAFDVVFHDPFSPARVPAFWTVDLFRAYARLLVKPTGKLLTYSAAGAVRGGLIEAGFAVGKTLPLGRRQAGTIAGFEGAGFGGEIFNPPYALPLNETETAFLLSRSGIPYRDENFSSSHPAVVRCREAEQAASDRPGGNHLREKLLQK